MIPPNQNPCELPQNKPQYAYTASTLLLAPLSGFYVSVICPSYHGLVEDASSSRPKHISGETNNFIYQSSSELSFPYTERRQTPNNNLVANSRLEKIKKIKGKYAYVRTSSEDFALRKKEEIEIEGNF